MKTRFLLICLLIAISIGFLHSQISSGGIPLSFGIRTFAEHIHQIIIPPPNIRILAKEDSLNDNLDLPHRFMEIIPVKIDLTSAGSWMLQPNGSAICRLKLISEGALAISLYFDRFYLPAGTKLFLYDESGNQVKGSYTQFNNSVGGLFATELIFGNTVILELNCESGSERDTPVIISGFGYAYREIPRYIEGKGFGTSEYCEINVNCSPEGSNWQSIKSGVIRLQIKVSGSAYWCTGSLVNNAKNDRKPYILTADHCAYHFGHYASEADLMQWLFYFNYESATCENPTSEPELLSMVGATKIANGGEHGNTGSDFYLVLLNQYVPAGYHPYFNGWSAINEPSTSGVTIHHPDGDIKKISTYNQPLVSTNWFNNTVQSHWKVFWTETENGWGVTEGGSSGSPLFNNAGRIVGTLTGGYAACDPSGVYGPDKPDYYGKFSWHWASNGSNATEQLKPWLDPDNTGLTFLDGLYVGQDMHLPVPNPEILVYPNPAHDFLVVNFTNFEPSCVIIEFADVMGTVVLKKRLDKPLSTETFHIGDWRAGIYFMSLYGKNVSHVTRFIKK